MHEIISLVEILSRLMTKENYKPKSLRKFWGNRIAEESAALKLMKPLFERLPKIFTECGGRIAVRWSGSHRESNCLGLFLCSSFEELSNLGYSLSSFWLNSLMNN